MARTVVVTGGGTGIGKAIAAAFRAEGDTVIITGRRTGPLRRTVTELGPSVHARACDATDPGEVTEFAAGLGIVDILVNNAGGNTDFDRGEPDDLAGLAANWQANFTANLLGAVLMTEATRPKLARGGAVISLGSIAADTGSGAYGAAKAGLASWNISLAARLGPAGVTANVVSPGYIGQTEFFRDQLTDERRDTLVAATHSGRPGTPDDVAATVTFLASPAARHITGQTLAVNGGAHATR